MSSVPGPADAPRRAGESLRGEQSFSLGYHPALDGIRAIAVMAVVLVHIFGWPVGGFLGVDMFFVLSGFLITSLLLQEWGQRRVISFRNFYRRRALRLLPALGAMILVYLLLLTVRVFVGAEVGVSHNVINNYWGALLGPLYLENILMTINSSLRGELILLWSLATEEQFYLLFPPVLFYMLTREFSNTRILKILGGLTASVFLWRLTWSLLGASDQRLYFGPDMRFDSILTGCAISVVFVLLLSHRIESGRFLRVLGILGGIYVALSVLFVGARRARLPFYSRGGFTLFAVACAGLILYIVSEPQSRVSRALSTRPFVFLGRLSYSIYLWHMVVLIAVTSVLNTLGNVSRPMLFGAEVLMVLLSVVVGYGSYRLIEVPFLRRKRKYESKAEGQSVPEVSVFSSL